MKILIAVILAIMTLYAIVLLIQEYIDGKKLQKEQDEIKRKYHE